MKNGYWQLQIDGENHLLHHVVWLYVYGVFPDGELDHRDTDGGNNRIANLRPATSSQQKWNAKRRYDNTSGYKGVHFFKRTGKWQAYISAEGKRRNLGYFATPEEAYAVRCAAAVELHGEFARAA